MKVFSVILFDSIEEQILERIEDLSTFGFFDRKFALEFFTFISKSLLSRCLLNDHTSVIENNYKIHCYNNGILGIVIITDHEYDQRPIYYKIHKIINRYTIGDRTILTKNFLLDMQDPAKYDKICKINKNLNETMNVLHESIENILKRGEDLDQLVEKSKDLSICSKEFYRQSKKHNSCCIIN